MSAIVDHWRARPERERRVLGALTAIIVLILIATLVWLPLERERRRLASDIPKLSAALATMERKADEVKRVRSLPTATAAPLASVVSSGSLTRTIPGAQATIADDKRVRIIAADAPYGALLESIASAQVTHGLRVESARIEALGAAGRVRAELTLAKP